MLYFGKMIKGDKMKQKPIDDEDFLNTALNKGFEMGDIQDFIADYFQNLNSVKQNLNELKEFVESKDEGDVI